MSEVKKYKCNMYEDTHEITKCGRIFRKEFIDKQGFKRKARELFGQNHRGYRMQEMGKNINGKRTYVFVHRLVALTFIDNIMKKPQVNHIDGNKSNNNLENLEWCTAKENIEHAISTKLLVYKKKINNNEKKEIIQLFKDDGVSTLKISKKFNVNPSTIYYTLQTQLTNNEIKEISSKISSWKRFTKTSKTGIRKMEEGKKNFRLTRKGIFLGWFYSIEEAIEFKKDYINNHNWKNG